ncbi:MAG: lytic transglycosylase domain-containing protein [Zetaproteobacteria bacterium]|nr:lytic transglycosylase domain-containing protein [Zetaproteobacteria bacterium]
MMLGFFFTIPIWVESTPEAQQRLTFATSSSQIIQQSTGKLSMTPTERARLAAMLDKPDMHQTLKDLQTIVWMEENRPIIEHYVRDEERAKEIAHWVYYYSHHFELEPALVLSVITVESHFDYQAKSRVGARGLMQVMPFWKKELGSVDDNLFDIETNIRYGCAVLRHYINRYGTLSRALSAYNGSLGRSRYPNKVYKAMQKFQKNITNV